MLMMWEAFSVGWIALGLEGVAHACTGNACRCAIWKVRGRCAACCIVCRACGLASLQLDVHLLTRAGFTLLGHFIEMLNRKVLWGEGGFGGFAMHLCGCVGLGVV